MFQRSFPSFQPYSLLAGGHRQTIGAHLLAPKQPYRARQHHLPIEDDQQIVLHEDEAAGWRAGNRAVLMVHGLAGCHASPYMQRLAARLGERGMRPFRLDMRGCGAGMFTAWQPAHSDRTGDVLRALQKIAERCPGSPIALVGFSLGGNLVLNTAVEIGRDSSFRVDCAFAICPPIDLAACSGHLRKQWLRFYDRYFIRLLRGHIREKQRRIPQFPRLDSLRRPTSLWDFDDQVTAPLAGFHDAADYYGSTSPAPRLARLKTPTLIIADDDDPLIPASIFEGVDRHEAIELHITRGGGHLGYFGRRNEDPDRWWLDWRIVQCLEMLDSCAGNANPPVPCDGREFGLRSP